MATKRSGNTEDGNGASPRAGGTSRGAGGATRGGTAKKSAGDTGAPKKRSTGGTAKKDAGGTAKKRVAAKNDATGGARKTAATGRSGTTGARGTKRAKPDLRSDLRDFAAGRPEGWNHEDWMSFLEDLQARGHNIQDREEIGRALERERLDMTLEKAGATTPESRKALVERFGTVWSFRNADVDEIARVGNVSRSEAERIHHGI